MTEKQIGVVTHYFGKVGVAAVQLLEGELRVGDTIHIQGQTSDFTLKVESMQIEHQAVDSARTGDAVGLRVPEPARRHDLVYRVTLD